MDRNRNCGWCRNGSRERKHGHVGRGRAGDWFGLWRRRGQEKTKVAHPRSAGCAEVDRVYLQSWPSMSIRSGARLLLVILALAAAPEGVVAKGVTRHLTLAGPGLPAPLAVTAPGALANVWAGDFLGLPCDAPPAHLPRFLVSFHVQPPRPTVVRVVYVVHYVADPATGDGFIYLPGTSEEGYRRNIGTIVRPSQDGRWHRASEAWSRALNAHLP